MTYEVRLQPSAEEDLDDAYQYAAKHAPETAGKWVDRFYAALQTLSVNPERCVLAPKNPRSTRTLHQYLFGKGRNVFRVIFTIDEEAETVWIIAIRRATRRHMTEEELGDWHE